MYNKTSDRDQIKKTTVDRRSGKNERRESNAKGFNMKTVQEKTSKKPKKRWG